MKATQIIIGIPTQENMLRARKVAEALGFDWGKKGTPIDTYLANNYPNRPTYVAFNGVGKFDSYSELVASYAYGHHVIDLRPYDSHLTVKLNDEYSAEVSPDKQTVKVGCQTFDSTKIKELAKLLE